MSYSVGQNPFRILLVENNPYDRAVIDACLEADQMASVRYTKEAADGTMRPIGPVDLWDYCANNGEPPDLILLDLALTKRCEKALASTDYRAFLHHRHNDLHETDYALAEWDIVVRPLLVEATLVLARLEEGKEYNEATRRAKILIESHAPNKLPDSLSAQQASRILTGLRIAIANNSKVEEVLLNLWGSQCASATVQQLAKAPSILRIFACVATFSNRCFGVVSHYADRDTQLALKTILKFRNRSSLERHLEEVLDELIINKAALLVAGAEDKPTTLSERLRKAHKLWMLHQSPEVIVAPYGALPVLTPDGRVLELWQCVEKTWPKEIVPGLSPGAGSLSALTVIVWDETKLIVGREGAWRARPDTLAEHLGWERLFHKDVASLEGIDVESLQAFPKSHPATHPVCYVVKNEVTDEQETQRFVRFARAHFLRSPRSPRRIVFVGGAPTARKALEDRLVKADRTSLYRIPHWSHKVWTEREKSSRQFSIFASLREAIRKFFKDGERKTKVIYRLVTEFRVKDRDDPDNRCSFSEALAGIPGVPESARRVLQILTRCLVAEPDPLTRWTQFENKAELILDRLHNNEDVDKVLQDTGFRERTSALSDD